MVKYSKKKLPSLKICEDTEMQYQVEKMPPYAKILPISAVIPTKDRPLQLDTVLKTILSDDVIPSEIIIVDSSSNNQSQKITHQHARIEKRAVNIEWMLAEETGAAIQREQGLKASSMEFVLFIDDDMELFEDCIKNLFLGLMLHPEAGGVSTNIVNQQYEIPGLLSRLIFKVIGESKNDSRPGGVIGPAVHFLPSGDMQNCNFAEVDWLNLGCTLYRKSALPRPLFNRCFQGYSMMEDLELSLQVGKSWKLIHASQAKAKHNSETSEQKENVYEMSKMELINRAHIMANVLGKNTVKDYFRFGLWEVFLITAKAFSGCSLTKMRCFLLGKIDGVRCIVKTGRFYEGTLS